MANISDVTGLASSSYDSGIQANPEDSNINRFMLDCLPFNDVSFKQGAGKTVNDGGSLLKSITDSAGYLKSQSDASGYTKAPSDGGVSSLYTLGDSRILIGNNSTTIGGFPY